MDLDHDGVMDGQQSTIKSVKMEGTPVQIGVSIKGSPTALAIEAVESEDPRQMDSYANGKPATMPFGIISFKIAVNKPGDQAVVNLYFSEAAAATGRWFMYDPVAGEWDDFSANVTFASDRLSAALTLTDGGLGDADGIANGVIVDPSGLGVPDSGDVNGNQSVDSGSSGGSGGGGSCLIDTIAGREMDGTLLSCMSLLGISCLLSLSSPVANVRRRSRKAVRCRAARAERG